MQVQWWEYHEMVGTLKHYLVQKNLFELFALTGREGAKTLGASTQPFVALKSHLVELPQHLIACKPMHQ